MNTLTIREPRFIDPILSQARNIAARAIAGGPVCIELKRESKSRLQEEKYHSMIGDISKTVRLDGKQYGPEIWKALLVDEFELECENIGQPLRHKGETIVSLDSKRRVTIRASTSKFLKKEASNFIEFLFMKGSEYGAVFSDRSMKYYEEEAERMG